jgi:hypothetical protein
LYPGFGTKKDYTVYLKDYMKKVIKYLEDNNRYGTDHKSMNYRLLGRQKVILTERINRFNRILNL